MVALGGRVGDEVLGEPCGVKVLGNGKLEKVVAGL